MANNLGSLVIGVSTDLDPFARGLKKADGMMSSFVNNLGKGMILGAGMNFAKGLGDNLIGRPVDLITSSIKMAAAWEKSTVQFEVMLGSATKADGMMDKLRKFAAESPLTLAQSIDEAKKLMSSGVTDTNIIPTMRLLSDLSLGNFDIMQRLNKAYTDVKAKATLQGQELRQFTETGIPLVAALAETLKKPQNEIHSLIEQGKIGFSDLQRALLKLTSKEGVGGLSFFEATAKGAKTAAGQFEQMRDAAEGMKRHLGDVLIEEWGLKEAARDGAGFLKEQTKQIDLMRPGIRFIGDAIKGIAQVGGEGIRMLPEFAKSFFDTISRNAPGVGRAFESINEFIEKMKKFKGDPDFAAQLGQDFANLLIDGFSGLFEFLEDGLKHINTTYIKPIADEIKSAADAWRMIKGVGGAVNDVGQQAGHIARLVKESFGQYGNHMPDRKDVVPQLTAGITPFLNDVTNPILKSKFGVEPGTAYDPNIASHFVQGMLPKEDYLRLEKALPLMKAVDDFKKKSAEYRLTQYDSKWSFDVKDIDAAQKKLPIAQLEMMRSMAEMGRQIEKADQTQNTKNWMFNGQSVYGLEEKKADNRSFMDKRREQDAKALAAQKWSREQGNMEGVGKMVFLDPVMKKGETTLNGVWDDLSDFGMKVGNLTMKLPNLGMDNQKLQVDEVPGNLLSLASTLNQEFKNPVEKFSESMKNLQDLTKYLDPQTKKPLLDDRKFALAAGQLIQNAMPNKQLRLPTGAEYGSQEVVNMYSNSVASGRTIEGLLMQIAESDRQLVEFEKAKVTAAGFDKPPPVVQVTPR